MRRLVGAFPESCQHTLLTRKAATNKKSGDKSPHSIFRASLLLYFLQAGLLGPAPQFGIARLIWSALTCQRFVMHRLVGAFPESCQHTLLTRKAATNKKSGDKSPHSIFRASLLLYFLQAGLPGPAPQFGIARLIWSALTC
jgi:hypothetical protein